MGVGVGVSLVWANLAVRIIPQSKVQRKWTRLSTAVSIVSKEFFQNFESLTEKE